MEDNGHTPWQRLVEQALADSEQVGAIFEVLDPILRRLARGLRASYRDDALQAAHVAIWRALPKVDLTRGRSIRGMLLRTAYHAMCGEIRQEIRRARVPLEPLRGKPRFHLDAPPRRFGGLLELYAGYVRRHGTFSGAHRSLARELGLSPAKTTAEFHRAAREYIDREDLRPANKQYGALVEKILRQAAKAGS